MARTEYLQITPVSAGERADRGIALELEERNRSVSTEEDSESPPLEIHSRSRIQKLIEQGLVLCDGNPIRSNLKLREGMILELRLPDPEPLALVPEAMPLDILFEDDHLLVVNKPPGLTVHPSETQKTGTLVHGLLHHIGALSGIGGVLRPGIVHRIDKDTSGALVVTKSDAAHQGLSALFAKHDIERTYHAVCYGALKQASQTISSLIGRNPNDRKKMSMNVQEGRKAVTHIKRLREYAALVAGGRHSVFATLVEARLETGRTHQIRVHLTGIEHSLLGDPVYGTPGERHPKWLALPDRVRERTLALPGQALHARTLGFVHPITREKMLFEAPYPSAFKELIEELEKNA